MTGAKHHDIYAHGCLRTAVFVAQTVNIVLLFMRSLIGHVESYAEFEQVLDKGLEFDEFGGRVARCQKRVSQYYRDDGTSVRRCLRPWDRLPACRESWQAGNLSHDHLGERPDFASPQTYEVSEDFGSLAVSFHWPLT